MNKAELIIITEHYENETSCTGAYDYNTLPENVKDNVDKAIWGGGREVPNQYEDGLQFLFRTNHPEIKTESICTFKGRVEFWEC